MKEKEIRNCLEKVDKECLGEGVNQEEVEKVMFGFIDDTMFVGNDGSNKMNIPSVSHSTPIAKNNMSYVKATNKLVNLIKNKLINIPTDTDDGRNEFMVFDEELVNEGSKRWQLTLCGFFVGFKMKITELRYNVRRMWSRYGLKDVRFCNPPLEALTVKECGKIGYARVLIEVSTNKGLLDKIDIVYKNASKETIRQGVILKKGSGKRDKHGITTENAKRSANKYSVLENLDEEDEMVRKPKGDKMKSRKLDDNCIEEIKDVYSMEDGMEGEMNEGDSTCLDGKILQDCCSVILEKYLEAVKDEEKLLYQKCKIKWLSYGDKNNSFFHKILKGRNQRNRIPAIYDSDGQRYEGDQIPFQFVNHFKKFLGLKVPEAMFSIADNKAPRPDGFSAKIFKSTWHTVGPDVCSAVKEFFYFGKLLGELNATIISLIPKITTTLLVTDFIPIACKLPIKYLGVPLISKRLGIKDLINDINGIMKNFLWSQNNDSKGKAKVAWKAVCKPKNQGGLGLKDLFVWNNALLVKHLWNIANKKDTLWVKWVSTIKLNGVSIWVVQKEECDSWGWKNLLTIRDLIMSHVLYKIGNGKNTYMWYDNLSGLGPLINIISHRILYNARLNKVDNVANMIDAGNWKNGSEWVNNVSCLATIPVPVIK
nr:hypothetical protein [Tanacetum cinerariifolium]